MNDMQVFKDNALSGTPLEKQLELLGSLALMLADALLSCDEGDYEKAEITFNEAAKLGHPFKSIHFNELYGAARSEATWKRISDRRRGDTK